MVEGAFLGQEQAFFRRFKKKLKERRKVTGERGAVRRKHGVENSPHGLENTHTTYNYNFSHVFYLSYSEMRISILPKEEL